jgi:hypothetical protein
MRIPMKILCEPVEKSCEALRMKVFLEQVFP